MYLAQKQINGKTHYIIRESIDDGEYRVSRDLFDLGAHPEQYVVYPGGNAFYIHEDVCEQLVQIGVAPDNDELEKLFWPFLRYETRRVIEGFTHKATGNRTLIKDQCRLCETAPFHLFDQRRMHYLRFGELDQSRLGRVPKKIFREFLDKSRDEIEQLFLTMENVLDANEKKTYAYVIFDVPGYFPGGLSRKFPQALDQDKVDEYFLKQVCLLHTDDTFWAGMKRSDTLSGYLVRYVCWFFDHAYADSRYLDELVYDWMARHRDFRPPRPPSNMALDDALSVMGMKKAELAGLTVKTLTRRYRKMAQKMHPDAGGGHNRFIKLTQAYEDLLRKVRGRGKKSGYSTQRG